MLLFYLCFMLEVRAVRCRDHYEPVKYVLAELASVELGAERQLEAVHHRTTPQRHVVTAVLALYCCLLSILHHVSPCTDTLHLPCLSSP